jgi:simple sugar transport system substrate-binding protein
VSEPRLDRGTLVRWATAAAAGAALPAGIAGAATAAGFPVAHPRWRMVFVNHAVTNPFFVPTRYGIEDACSLLGVTADWTGSATSDVAEMGSAFAKAVKGDVGGIAVSIIDPTAFDALTAQALELGIPVVAYNADGARRNRRLAYVGQDLYESGLRVGARITQLVTRGDVYVFIATPGQQNIQPRVDGVLDAIADAGRPIDVHVVATGPDVGGEARKIDETVRTKRGVKGLFAVDGGSTQGVAEVMTRYGLRAKGVRAGGYDLLPATLRAIEAGIVDFTIDQQPYLQGFVPVLEMFLWRYSGGLVSPADTNTGLVFVTRRNVRSYLTTHTRFEGSSPHRQFPPA